MFCGHLWPAAPPSLDVIRPISRTVAPGVGSVSPQLSTSRLLARRGGVFVPLQNKSKTADRSRRGGSGRRLHFPSSASVAIPPAFVRFVVNGGSGIARALWPCGERAVWRFVADDADAVDPRRRRSRSSTTRAIRSYREWTMACGTARRLFAHRPHKHPGTSPASVGGWHCLSPAGLFRRFVSAFLWFTALRRRVDPFRHSSFIFVKCDDECAARARVKGTGRLGLRMAVIVVRGLAG